MTRQSCLLRRGAVDFALPVRVIVEEIASQLLSKTRRTTLNPVPKNKFFRELLLKGCWALHRVTESQT
jgi:hypothetical protein